MNDAFLPAIAALQDQLAKDQKAVSETKKMINKLSGLAGQPAPYPDTDESEAISIGAIRSDTFYGKKMATVLREYLEMRRSANLGPAETREIYEAVIKGGYQFETTNPTNAMTGMRQLMTKNTNQFHKLPNGAWGLTAWYENIKASRKRQEEGADEEAIEEKGAASETMPATPK